MLPFFGLYAARLTDWIRTLTDAVVVTCDEVDWQVGVEERAGAVEPDVETSG